MCKTLDNPRKAVMYTTTQLKTTQNHTPLQHKTTPNTDIIISFASRVSLFLCLFLSFSLFPFFSFSPHSVPHHPSLFPLSSPSSVSQPVPFVSPSFPFLHTTPPACHHSAGCFEVTIPRLADHVRNRKSKHQEVPTHENVTHHITGSTGCVKEIPEAAEESQAGWEAVHEEVVAVQFIAAQQKGIHEVLDAPHSIENTGADGHFFFSPR